ncbi:MAG: 2-oxoacid:acceptor oxidoreductase family protein, partial [bacterium]
MKKDIILCGVGGQGILTIAATIGTAALKEGLQLKQAEVHGMSQRGGDVQSHLRLSSQPIASDLIPEGKA